jgi:molecular chaperone HtpG
MKEGQEEIYFITGENLKALLNSPHLEALKEKDYEVLVMTDPVDEWVVQSLTEYDGRKLVSAEKGDMELDEEDKDKKDSYSKLFDFMKQKLEDKVKEVKLSSRLKNSVACLSGDQFGMSAYMEKIMKATGQEIPVQKRILELNVNHPVLEKVKTMFEQDTTNPVIAEYCELLYDIAVISEGGKIDNPSEFSKRIGDMMSKAI